MFRLTVIKFVKYHARDVMFVAHILLSTAHPAKCRVVSARKMHFVFRTASCATRTRSFLLQTGPVVPPATFLSHGNHHRIRLSSTAGHESAAKNQTKTGANTPPKGQSFSSIRPLPTPPPPPKGTPLTINTHDIEQYVQPLYARGWGFSRIFLNGNGIAVLRKRFEFANVEALEGFLVDLAEYEEKKQVRSHYVCQICQLFETLPAPCKDEFA